MKADEQYHMVRVREVLSSFVLTEIVVLTVLLFFGFISEKLSILNYSNAGMLTVDIKKRSEAGNR